LASPYLKQANARVGMQARKWKLDSLLDVGGMAAVYIATHRNGNRVAVKVLHRQYAKNEDARGRFMREGYAANKVGHPNAVTVMDDDQLDDGTPFLVMELLDGHALETRMRQKGVLEPAEILYVVDKVLDVLASAHERGIIHRDIKPPNIYLTVDGNVKVLDFGLARVLDPGADFSLTRTGTVIGTASYMSPEQARGKREKIDHRTDIWAAGAVIFRALSGRNVHSGESAMDRLLAAMTNHAPSLAEVAPNAPAEVVTLVDRALAFQKSDRFDNAQPMQAAVRQAYESITGEVMPGAGQVQAVAGWTTPEPEPSTKPSGADDIHVSVVIDEPETGDSIFVEFSDDEGTSKRYELRRKPSTPKMQAVSEDDEPLSEVSVVVDVDE
jgi:serine/threonine protein kinase